VSVILPVVVRVDCLDFNFTIENFLHVDNPETNVSVIFTFCFIPQLSPVIHKRRIRQHIIILSLR
jgi:hypothetical protein